MHVVEPLYPVKKVHDVQLDGQATQVPVELRRYPEIQAVQTLAALHVVHVVGHVTHGVVVDVTK